MEIAFTIFIIIAVLGIFSCTNQRVYNFIYNRKEWNAWKKVIEDIDTLKPGKIVLDTQRLLKFDADRNLEYYIVRFIDDGDIGIFNNENSCIGTKFDKYHHNIVKRIIDEKYPISEYINMGFEDGQQEER